MEAMVSENECVRFANNQRGYVRFDLTPKELRADFRVVEYVSKPGSPIKTRASFVVEDGQARPEREVEPSWLKEPDDPGPLFVQRVVRDAAVWRADTSNRRSPRSPSFRCR